MKHHKIVIDSCIFIKLFVDEDDSLQAISLFEKLINDKTKILLPEIYLYEILTAVIRSGGKIDDVFYSLKFYEEAGIEVVKLDEKLAKKAAKIIKIGNAKSGYPSFCDAIYHATAIENNCTFLTADKKYYNKVKEIGNIEVF